MKIFSFSLKFLLLFLFFLTFFAGNVSVLGAVADNSQKTSCNEYKKYDGTDFGYGNSSCSGQVNGGSFLLRSTSYNQTEKDWKNWICYEKNPETGNLNKESNTHTPDTTDKLNPKCVRATPTCTITKKETANPTSGEFNHVLYGNLTPNNKGEITAKISNSNGEIPQTQQDLIFPLLEDLGITGDWQTYESKDDTEPNNTGKDTATTDADPLDTKYYVYGNQTRYALTTIKNAENNFAGYNIYSLTCNEDGELEGTDTPVTGMCQNTGEVWNSAENTCQVPQPPTCGTANGENKYFLNAPTQNLCSVGDASDGGVVEQK